MRSSGVKGRRVLRWAAELLLVAAIVAGIQYWRTRDAVSGQAPPLVANLLNGAIFDIAAAPRPLLVHFWATWCPICRMEEGSIHALAADASVVTVALSSGDDRAVAGYLREQGLAFPVINDPDGVIAREWGVVGVPTSFVIDAGGQVRFITSGYTTGPGLRLRLWLAGQ